MKIIKSNRLSEEQKEEIFNLWNNEYPRNLGFSNISELEHYFADLTDQNHVFLVDEENRIRGWYFDFLRENERWFATIINSRFQGKNLGSQLLQLAQQNRQELNGWVITTNDYKKVNGKDYKPPLDFYLKTGFSVIENVTLQTDKLTAIKIHWIRK